MKISPIECSEIEDEDSVKWHSPTDLKFFKSDSFGETITWKHLSRVASPKPEGNFATFVRDFHPKMVS